jgi:hypothetical protein
MVTKLVHCPLPPLPVMREFAVVSGCVNGTLCLTAADYLVVKGNVIALQSWVTEVQAKCGEGPK